MRKPRSRPPALLLAPLLAAAGCVFQPGAPQPIDDADAAVAPSPPDLAVAPDLAVRPPDLVVLFDLAVPPDLVVPGRWYQADSAHCPDFCAKYAMTNVPGPDGASCESGETRSASAIAAGIRFTYGCWSDCSAQPAHAATTVVRPGLGGGYCYAPGQNHDWDDTDRTVGCFCR